MREVHPSLVWWLLVLVFVLAAAPALAQVEKTSSIGASALPEREPAPTVQPGSSNPTGAARTPEGGPRSV